MFGNFGDLDWLPSVWDSLQEFANDPIRPEMLDTPPSIELGRLGEINTTLSHLNLPEFSSSSGALTDGFDMTEG